jgi:hypothetical protein
VILDLRRFPEPSATFARPRFHDRRMGRILPDIRHNPAQTTITRRLEVVHGKRAPRPVTDSPPPNTTSRPGAITDRNQLHSTTRSHRTGIPLANTHFYMALAQALHTPPIRCTLTDTPRSSSTGRPPHTPHLNGRVAKAAR